MNIIITIGGTGAKAGESLVYLMAAGLIKGSYEIFMIDKDKNLVFFITEMYNK